MKKKRFGLLAKIMLLTGVLTVLTVSTSLTVNLLISRHNTREAYKESCENVTDSIESVFFDTEDLVSAKTVLNKVISHYDEIKNEYDQMDEIAMNKYTSDLITDLFEPAPGTMGMDYEKSVRKNYYYQAASRMQTLCANYKVPHASLNLFDPESKRLIFIAHGDLNIQDNIAAIGTVDDIPEQWEIDFYNSASTDVQFKTDIVNEVVMSYNFVNVEIDNANYKCFVRGQYPLTEVNQSFNKQLLAELIISIASAAFLVAIYAIFTKLFFLRNVDRLENSTKEFVGAMKENKPIEIVDSNVKSHDEMKDLSDSFMVMQEQIINYIDNIKKAKAVEQAFNTEVDIASKIQLESLPAKVHYNENIELRSFIKPAKGVGGDFYDYFYIDKNHLAVVIADVSGKGIPASLFMMRSKESLRSASMNEKDLSNAFFKVNNALCLNNKEGYFVTVFLGVLDLKTYEFDCISAGHERPFIKRDGKCYRLNIESNFVLGLEEDFEYKKQKIQLQEGDTIMLYTDGLNEAINTNNEEFGYENIEKSLQKADILRENIEILINDLEAFEGEEEQFDDITVLSFNIKKNVVSYSYLCPTYDDITDLTNKVEDYLEGLDPVLVSKIGVIVDEVMNNIISYGKTKTNKVVTLSIEKTEDGATLVFVDNSHPFNPLLKEKRTVQENMEEGIVGGLGISIVKSISKETEYTYSNNKNILIIKF